MFSRDVQSDSSLAGPLQDIYRVVQKQLLCYCGSLLRVVVLLLNLCPSLRTSVFWSRSGSEHCCIHLPLTLTSVPLLKNIPKLDAATTMLRFRDGIGQVVSGVWFPPGAILGIQTKELKLGFIRPENFVFRTLRVLQVSFSKFQVMS